MGMTIICHEERDGKNICLDKPWLKLEGENKKTKIILISEFLMTGSSHMSLWPEVTILIQEKVKI